MKHKELAKVGKELFATTLEADAEGTTWAITVSVGMDGTEKKMFVQPTDRIAQLKAQVKAELGMAGKLYRTDTEEIVELLDDATIESCLIDEALVWLDSLLDEFTQAKEALLSIRDQMKKPGELSEYYQRKLTHRRLGQLGWDNLETFTEMEELAQCTGVTVEDGHVTKLNLRRWGLTELSTLPPKLEGLDCSDCKLTELPTLPPTLEKLNCNRNHDLTKLPALPATLKGLKCFDCGLTKLPALPATLEHLNCEYCEFTGRSSSLIDGPENIVTLTDEEKAAIQAQAPNCNIKW